MLICSCRHVPTSTTTAWKRFAIAAAAASPMQHVDSRRRYDTWAEAWAHNMVVYASNSVVSQCFVGTYQALCSLAPVSPTAAILATTLGLRLVTFPLYAYSEKLASKRLIAMNVIQHQVCEKVGKHYGVKPVVDERTEQLTLDTGDKLILDNYRQLTNQTVQTYTTERRLRFERIFFLKLSPVYFWLCASMGLRMHVAEIVADGSPPLSGFLWLSSVGAPDPYMVLPLCFGALSLLNIWSTKWMFTVPGAKRRWTGHLIDGLMIMGAGVGVKLLSTMPAMQSIYWCAVLSTTLCQTLLLRHPTIKSWLRIDRLPTDSATPFRELFRFRRKKLPLRTF